MAHTAVPVAALKIGMFVAELDRPWIETPFLTDGFRIVEADQLEVLRAYCRRVFIDALRSSPESLSHLGDLRARRDIAGWDGDHDFERALVRVFPEWKRKPGIVSRLDGRLARIRQFLRGRGMAAIGRARSARRAGLRSSAVPAEASLWLYRNHKSARGEMVRARPVYLHTEAFLDICLKRIAAGESCDLDELDRIAETLSHSIVANPQPLLWLASVRALGLRATDHSMRVAIHMLALGRFLGVDAAELRRLAIIGLCLDLGKARIPGEILHKPETLGEDELREVRRHVEYSLAALGGKSAIEEAVYRGIAEHHERLDGSGYPHALKDAEIGFHGRVAAIADTYATLTTRRSYAPAMSPFDAMRVLYASVEIGFSRALLEDFMAALGVYPVGSLIELASGEVAAVLGHVAGHPLRPRILLLTDPDKLPRPARPVDLLSNPKDRNDHIMRIERGLPLGAFGLDPRRFQLG